MRAILDTNVLIAALLWRGPPHQLLEQVRNGTLTLASSPVLLAELTHILSRAKFDSILVQTHTPRERALDEVRQLSALIDAPPLPRPVCRDPDDDAVLACAIAAQVDFIVSGDLDLLVLKHYQHIPIVNPREALGLIDAAQK